MCLALVSGALHKFKSVKQRGFKILARRRSAAFKI